MSTFVVRFIQRFSVFALGAVAIYVAVWQIYPFFDHRLPFALALLLTYVVMAYIVLPAAVRLVQLFVRPAHIPLYCVTPDGFASDPINVGIVGTREELTTAMQQAGWFLADKHTVRNIGREIVTIMLRRVYQTAPMSNLFLFGRKQDLGFELPIKGFRGHRHHVRFWACNLGGPEAFHSDVRFWRRLQRPLATAPGRQLWVGAASKDIGLAPIRHNAQITHRVAPDTNAERDLIVRQLQKTKFVASTRTLVVGRPYGLRNRALRSFLRADGRLTICELKQ